MSWRIQNKFHKYPNYPVLPERTPKENELPFQIGSKVLEEAYNNFLEKNGSTGYKFCWKNGNVYIVDMASTVHGSIVSRLIKYFNVPNGGVDDDPPIDNTLQAFHFDPSHVKIKTGADLAICPHLNHIQAPLNLGPPPGDCDGNPHARIFVEVAKGVDMADLVEKCEKWLLQPYVRSVFGVKIYDKRRGTNDRTMRARLWTRQIPAPPGSTPSTNPRLAGISVIDWDFGTVQFNSNLATGCNRAGLANFTVTIPVSDIFWDPPIVAGAPNLAGYTVNVPPTVTAPNIVIDLYRLQQIALLK